MRKITEKYYFSVEGQTEEIYLKHLENLINNDQSAKKRVSFVIKICKPLSFVKWVSVLDPVEVTHIHDYESGSDEHQKEFFSIFSEMKDINEGGTKVSRFNCGHTNFCFELWILLHKEQLNGTKNHRSDYLVDINRLFQTSYSGLSEYKNRDNFKRILNQINIEDVKDAVTRSHRIDQTNQRDGNRKLEYKGFEYYKENPSLKIHEAIKKILDDVY